MVIVHSVYETLMLPLRMTKLTSMTVGLNSLEIFRFTKLHTYPQSHCVLGKNSWGPSRTFGFFKSLDLLIYFSARAASQQSMENLKLPIAVFIVFCVLLCDANESPQYTVVHQESDFEVRLYGKSTWMSASAKYISFEKATMDGFHRLFQFIQGANLNCSRIPMTLPVLTSIVPGAGPLHSFAYSVLFYLPAKFQAPPPIPLPELHLKPYNWSSHYVAVRKFSGYALDATIVEEAERLAFSLRRSPWANATSTKSQYAYSIAQYSSPLQLFGRVNEVWADVNASAFHGSRSSGVASF